MSELERFSVEGGAVQPLRPAPLGMLETRRNSRALTRMDQGFQLSQRAIEYEAQLGEHRAKAVTYVGIRAMELQAMASTTEQMIVTMEPGSIGGVSYLSQKLTLGLGRIIDKTVDEVT